MAGFSIVTEGAPAPDAADAGPSGASDDVPVLHAAHGEAAIDGKTDDAIWQRASPSPSTPTTRQVHRRDHHRAHGLGQRCTLHTLRSGLAGLITDTSRPTDLERPKLYEEDCVEMFLAPDPRGAWR